MGHYAQTVLFPPVWREALQESAKRVLLMNTTWFKSSATTRWTGLSQIVVAMVSGDPATFLMSLSNGLQGYNCPGDWVDTLKERDIEKEKANRYVRVCIYNDTFIGLRFVIVDDLTPRCLQVIQMATA